MTIAPLLAGMLLLAPGVQQKHPPGRLLYLGDPDSPNTRLLLHVNDQRLEPPKLSPKKFPPDDKPWEFEWVTSGLGRASGTGVDPNFHLRVRVFSQLRKQENDNAILTARVAMRLWDYNMQRLKIDHSEQFKQRVDFYLCWSGSPGGEHLFDVDTNDRGEKVTANTIYIYDLYTFTDPIEILREISHEYGHATLPGMRGFTEPEEWANGPLGEKLYMKWLRDDLLAGKLLPADVNSVNPAALDKWVKTNVEAHITRAALNGPQYGLLEGKGADSMDAYLGLACYAESILPSNVFALSLKITGSFSAKDYPAAIVNACLERQKIVIDPPAYLKGKEIWVPLGPKGNVTGAQLTKRNGSWGLIKPTFGGPITLNVKE